MADLPGHTLTVLLQEFERTMYQLVFWVGRPSKPSEVADHLERIAAAIRKGV